MQLTGKTEQQFKEWLKVTHSDMIRKWGHPTLSTLWEVLPEVCQLALKQEFLETLGFRFSFEYHDHLSQYTGKVKHIQSLLRSDIDLVKTSLEALKAAITKANDINNGR